MRGSNLSFANGHYGRGRAPDFLRNLAVARSTNISGTREHPPSPFAAPPQSRKASKRDSAQDAPAIWSQRQHPDRVANDERRHRNQEGSRETAMSPAAPSGVHDASRAHADEHDGPDDRAGRGSQPHGGQHGHARNAPEPDKRAPATRPIRGAAAGIGTARATHVTSPQRQD